MTWEIAMVGVMKVFKWEVHVWFVESVELVESLMNVVFNTITVSIVDSPSLKRSKLEKVRILKSFWAVHFVAHSIKELLVFKLNQEFGFCFWCLNPFLTWCWILSMPM